MRGNAADVPFLSASVHVLFTAVCAIMYVYLRMSVEGIEGRFARLLIGQGLLTRAHSLSMPCHQVY